jgi:hypothetical protein
MPPRAFVKLGNGTTQLKSVLLCALWSATYGRVGHNFFDQIKQNSKSVFSCFFRTVSGEKIITSPTQHNGNIMFYALNWFVVVSLFLIWSLAAWAFYAVAAWTVTNAGALAGKAGAIESMQLPVWLAPWVPSEYVSSLNLIFSALTPAIQVALEWAPSVAGGLSIAVWTVWGIGTVLLIVLGLFATGLIALLSRRGSTRSTSHISFVDTR